MTDIERKSTFIIALNSVATKQFHSSTSNYIFSFRTNYSVPTISIIKCTCSFSFRRFYAESKSHYPPFAGPSARFRGVWQISFFLSSLYGLTSYFYILQYVGVFMHTYTYINNTRCRLLSHAAVILFCSLGRPLPFSSRPPPTSLHTCTLKRFTNSRCFCTSENL